MFRSFARACCLACILAHALVGAAVAQSSEPAMGNSPATRPMLTKVDPPGWFANFTAPMLLVRGEHLAGTRFELSDPELHLAKTEISANGEWAQLWLAASPSLPETIRITAVGSAGSATASFTFAARRASSEGFAGFSSRDVLYLLMPDRFADGDAGNDVPGVTDAALRARRHAEELAKPRGWHGGDLQGVMDHLDYLQSLGVTALWMTPIVQNGEPDSYHGYGATDLYAVDGHFGTLADMRRLADALHRRHMKLVLDTVPNHVGPAHPWVKDEPMPDWFHGTAERHIETSGDFKPLVDPHSAARDRVASLDGWFANVLPDMNQGNPAVARYLIQNALWWIEQTGADGLRIDTFPYVQRSFWHEFHAQIGAVYPRVTTVGEVFNPDAAVVSSFAGGVVRAGSAMNSDAGIDTGLSTPFDFPTYFALRSVFAGSEPMTLLADVLREDALYPHPERLVPFLGNHDTKRFLSDKSATPARLREAFAVLLTMRGMPQIYSGDEIAMQGGDDPDNRRDFPGGFAAATHDAFTRAGRTPEEQEMFAWVQGLIAARKAHVALQTGEEQMLQLPQADRADSLVYVRGAKLGEGCSSSAGERVLVAVNRGDRPLALHISLAGTALAGCGKVQEVRLAAEAAGAAGMQADGTLLLTLAPASTLVAEVNR